MAAWGKLVLEQLLHSVLCLGVNAPLLCKEVVTSTLGQDQSTAMQDLRSSFRCSMGVSLLFKAFQNFVISCGRLSSLFC